MSKRNYMALMHDYLDEMSELSDEEFGRLCRMLLTYSITGECPDPQGNERFYLKRVIAQENRMQELYDQKAETNKRNGSSGGRPKKTQTNQDEPRETENNPEKPNVTQRNPEEPKKTQTNPDEPKKPNSSSISSSISISPYGDTPPLPPSRGGTRAKRFTQPTLAEVQSYVAERHSAVDPQGFIDFYESKGWMVGKTPMKDWKAACRNAEKWDRWAKRPASKPVNTPTAPEQMRRNAEWMRQMLESAT